MKTQKGSAMKKVNRDRPQILIECPNTIFHLFVENEDELSKIEIFMNNIRTVKSLSLLDIYHWCNRQGIAYDTSFNYHKEFTFGRTFKAYYNYTKQKFKYQLGYGLA